MPQPDPSSTPARRRALSHAYASLFREAAVSAHARSRAPLLVAMAFLLLLLRAPWPPPASSAESYLVPVPASFVLHGQQEPPHCSSQPIWPALAGAPAPVVAGRPPRLHPAGSRRRRPHFSCAPSSTASPPGSLAGSSSSPCLAAGPCSGAALLRPGAPARPPSVTAAAPATRAVAPCFIIYRRLIDMAIAESSQDPWSLIQENQVQRLPWP